MSMNLMVKAMTLKIGSPIRKLVLIKLADNANDKGECWPSYQHIADQCELSKSAVRKHIKQLEKDGFLVIENRKGEKGNSSNLYHLRLHPIARDDTPISPQTTPLCHEVTPEPVTIEPVNEPKERAKAKRFAPPSLDEVSSYCRERGNSIDPEQFIDFYSAKNWMIGKNKMKDWKAAVRTWEKRENKANVGIASNSRGWATDMEDVF